MKTGSEAGHDRLRFRLPSFQFIQAGERIYRLHLSLLYLLSFRSKAQQLLRTVRKLQTSSPNIMQSLYLSIRLVRFPSLPQVHNGRALASFLLRGFGKGGDVWMLLEELAQGAAQDAHAGAMHDPYAGQAGEERAVNVP